MKRISQNSVLTILVLISFCFARADVNYDIATIKKLENATAVALLKNDVKFLEKNFEGFAAEEHLKKNKQDKIFLGPSFNLSWSQKLKSA